MAGGVLSYYIWYGGPIFRKVSLLGFHRKHPGTNSFFVMPVDFSSGLFFFRRTFFFMYYLLLIEISLLPCSLQPDQTKVSHIALPVPPFLPGRREEL